MISFIFGNSCKHLEFKGQLIALLPVAHWLELWCASLVAQVQFLACPVQSRHGRIMLNWPLKYASFQWKDETILKSNSICSKIF
jgi:hypothetical protein